MFRQIVVGVDEHGGGRDAIALARRLLAPNGAITLGYVYASAPYAQRSASAEYEASERRRAAELLEAARGESGIEARVRSCLSASVGRGLHELCDSEQADLLVVGSSRHGLLGRVLMGDATRASLNGARCAVAIAPVGLAGEPELMREIGVGYDGSPESRHAVEVARALAEQTGARLSAFEAVSLPAAALGMEASAPGEAVGTLVGEARDRLAALGGVEPHAAYGRPAEELAVYSASLDLLVVGSRGYGPVGRLVHGSTSHRLARSARCPLLVLTRRAPLVGDVAGKSQRVSATV